MTVTPPPALVLGRLADEQRLRALAAVVLGETSVVEVAERARLSGDQAARALAQLVGAGIVVHGEEGFRVDRRVFASSARAASRPRKKPVLAGATPAQEAVLRNFAQADGRIRALPARAGKRRLVLEYVAGLLEPDREHSEREINELLQAIYEDYVTLRRFLVDEGFLAREGGLYRRVSR